MLRYLSYWFMLPGNYKHGFSGSTLFWINTEVGADLRCQANNKRHWHMPTKQQSAGVYARKPTRQPKEPQKPKDFIIIHLWLQGKTRSCAPFWSEAKDLFEEISCASLHWCWHQRFFFQKIGKPQLDCKANLRTHGTVPKEGLPGPANTKTFVQV